MKLPFEYAILGALMKHPMHGYEMHRFLSSLLKGVWYVGMSNMYGMLKRLEARGCVVSTLEMDGSLPARKVFMVTQEGRARFEQWVSEPVGSIRDMRVEFITKLYFLRELGLSGGKELVEKQKAVCRDILQSFDRLSGEDSDFDRLLFDFRRCLIRSILSWLDRCTGFLESPRAGLDERREEEGRAS